MNQNIYATVYYSNIMFFFALGLAALCFLMFMYVAITEMQIKKREAPRANRNLESMGEVGDLAEKFAKSGFAPSALACAVLLTFLAATTGFALDRLRIVTLFGFSGQ